jgi:hypothetical protein
METQEAVVPFRSPGAAVSRRTKVLSIVLPLALLAALRWLAASRPSQTALTLYKMLDAVAIDDAMPAVSIDAAAWLTWPAHRRAQLAIFDRVVNSSEDPNDVLVFATASRFASYLEATEAATLFEEQVGQLRKAHESRLYVAVALLPLAKRARLCEDLSTSSDLATAYTRSYWPQASPNPPSPDRRLGAFKEIVARCLSHS